MSYRKRRVPRWSTLPWCSCQKRLRCLAAQDQIGETTRRHPGQKMISLGFPTCRLRNSLSYRNPMKRRTGRRKESTSAHPFQARRSLAPRRFCGFAKSGKLRDPEVSERLARVGINRIRPNSSQAPPGARAIQAITLGRPNEGRPDALHVFFS